jgi:hypothetical protein
MVVKATKAQMDSTHSSKYSADKCIDNNLNNNNFCHNKGTQNGWLKVMYPAGSNIRKVEIYNRGDCCKKRIIGQKLEVFRGGRPIFSTTIVANGTNDIFAYRMPVALVQTEEVAAQNASTAASENSVQVMLTMTRKDCLSLREVRARDSLNRTVKATAASMDSAYKPWTDASKCVDGDTGVRLCHNGCAENGWIKVTFPSSAAMVEIFNRRGESARRLVGQKLDITRSGKSEVSTTIAEGLDYYAFKLNAVASEAVPTTGIDH